MKFLAALRFLTIIRVPIRRSPTAEDLGGSQVFFPLVGLIIGLTLAGLSWLFRQGLPTPIASTLLVVWLVIITGAMHLDGLADTCDGIGGQKTSEARLAVMRDSRIGGFGAVGIVLSLLIKFASISSLSGQVLILALIIMPVISRWMMVYAIFAYPYARPSGMGRAFKETAGSQSFSLATVLTLVIALGVVVWIKGINALPAGLVIISGVWIIIMVAAIYLKGKFSGLTGDTYGAINELAEVSILILVSLLANNRWLGLA